MNYKFTTHCPICHHALIEQSNERYNSLSYLCRFKPRHYFYLSKYYNREDDQFIRFIIPGYEITYIFNQDLFAIYSHDGDIITAHVMNIPKIDFDWKELQTLSDRIKKLAIFS